MSAVELIEGNSMEPPVAPLGYFNVQELFVVKVVLETKPWNKASATMLTMIMIEAKMIGLICKKSRSFPFAYCRNFMCSVSFLFKLVRWLFGALNAKATIMGVFTKRRLHEKEQPGH